MTKNYILRRVRAVQKIIQRVDDALIAMNDSAACLDFLISDRKGLLESWGERLYSKRFDQEMRRFARATQRWENATEKLMKVR